MGEVICHAPGDRCLNCDHYQGKSAVCGYAAMTNPTDLDELRGLLEKATPGTLRAEAGETAKLRDDFGLVAIMSHLTRYPLPVAGAATPSRRRDSDKVAALAHLVAAAVNALPDLLDELASARAKLDEYDERQERQPCPHDAPVFRGRYHTGSRRNG